MSDAIRKFYTSFGDTLWIVLAIILVIVMLFCNKKVQVYAVFAEQFKVFKNAREDKTSIWDVCCFVIMPLVLAVIIVFALGKPVDEGMASILTTVFSLVFTILFGFIAILVGRMDDSNIKKIELIVIKETFVSIITATLLSLCGTVTSIIVTQIEMDLAKSLISCVIYTISFVVVMLLLMTTKRVFKVYCERFGR